VRAAHPHPAAPSPQGGGAKELQRPCAHLALPLGLPPPCGEGSGAGVTGGQCVTIELQQDTGASGTIVSSPTPPPLLPPSLPARGRGSRLPTQLPYRPSTFWGGWATKPPTQRPGRRKTSPPFHPLPCGEGWGGAGGNHHPNKKAAPRRPFLPHPSCPSCIARRAFDAQKDLLDPFAGASAGRVSLLHRPSQQAPHEITLQREEHQQRHDNGDKGAGGEDFPIVAA
jgi:hypothetical protein